MIILKNMDICEGCPNFDDVAATMDAETRDFFKSLGLKIVLCKKYKECHKNLEDLYNFDGLEDDTDDE